MANEKNTQKVDPNAPQAYDYSSAAKVFGLTLTNKEIEHVEALTPAYVHELAHKNQWPLLIGEIVRAVILKTRNEGQTDEHTPVALEVKLHAPTFAATGNQVDGYKIREMNVGESVLMFVTGGMVMRQKLWYAAINPLVTQAASFRIEGLRDKPLKPGQNRMWDVDVVFYPKTFQRQNSTMLFEHDINARKIIDVIKLANGEVKFKDVLAKWEATALPESTTEARGLGHSLPANGQTAQA